MDHAPHAERGRSSYPIGQMTRSRRAAAFFAAAFFLAASRSFSQQVLSPAAAFPITASLPLVLPSVPGSAVSGDPVVVEDRALPVGVASSLEDPADVPAAAVVSEKEGGSPARAAETFASISANVSVQEPHAEGAHAPIRGARAKESGKRDHKGAAQPVRDQDAAQSRRALALALQDAGIFDGAHARPSAQPLAREPSSNPSAKGLEELRGLRGLALLKALHKLSGQGAHRRDYKESMHFLFSDADNVERDGARGIVDAYSGTFVPGTGGKAPDYAIAEKLDDGQEGPDHINAEHAVPHSFFGDQEWIYSDLHHMLAVSARANQKRSSLPFGEVSGDESPDYSNVGGAKAAIGVFEPPDFSKGRIARAVLYVFTRYYERKIHAVVDGVGRKVKLGSVFWGGGLGELRMILRWNREHPPTDFERRRNDIVQDFQGGRNPFVDDPSLADRIGEEVLRSAFALPKKKAPHRSLRRTAARGLRSAEERVQGNALEFSNAHKQKVRESAEQLERSGGQDFMDEKVLRGFYDGAQTDPQSQQQHKKKGHASGSKHGHPGKNFRGKPAHDRLSDFDGLSGEALLSALHKFAGRGHQSRGYHKACQYLFSMADNVTVDGKQGVADAYSGVFVPGTSGNGADYATSSDEDGDGYSETLGMNPEHVWPQSFFKHRSPMYADMHSLMATFSHSNDARGHRPFGSAANGDWYSNNGGAKSDGFVFEPPDFSKGRVARALLYFFTRYYDRDICLKAGQKGFWGLRVETFLRWNREYPPTNFEKRRNDLVEEFQGNRNPFVDDPMLADRIGAEAFRFPGQEASDQVLRSAPLHVRSQKGHGRPVQKGHHRPHIPANLFLRLGR